MPDCRAELPVEAFGRNRAAADGPTAYCRPCHKRRSKASYTRLHGSTRSYHLKRRYGLTADDVDHLVEQQGGTCALCRARRPQHVDHDHLTQRVRGVLCSGCNQGLGNFRDDAEALRQAVAYLEATTWQRRREADGVFRLVPPRPPQVAAAPSGVEDLIAARRAAL